MCGIVALLLNTEKESANSYLYEALNILQHRGQDAAGIITCMHGRLFQRKARGLVRDVFDEDSLKVLIGSMGIGHVRYPTAGSSSNAESQPFYVNSPYGISLAHNGNLTNSAELKQFLDYEAHRHINTDSDSEVLLNILAYELSQLDKPRIDNEDIFTAITNVNERCRGGYAVVAMITGFGIVAFRDKHGLRPLVIGQRETETGTDYIVASESVVLDVLGFTLLGDVAAGEAVIFRQKRKAEKGGLGEKEQNQTMERRVCLREKGVLTPCIFEYVYFARPDSIIDGISVYKARLAMGEVLARKISQDKKLLEEIDVIIPVPDTSRTAAMQLAVALNKTYREGFIKNRYVGRTFIMPGQAQRVKSVRRKLNVMPLEFQGKNVMLVDDSIVRGTTSAEIVKMAREAGANKVFFASCAPEIRHCNVYGIDMPTRNELVAYGRSVDDVAKKIGVDALVFQDLDGLIESILSAAPGTPLMSEFDCSVFNGVYVTGDINDEYLRALEEERADDAKLKKMGSQPEIHGLHNYVHAPLLGSK
eukprot:comp19055_c0_seq1/m.21497 comp19055_c0_seq1/g.21497  ORF comp19055_c0_seq1/g.21497 comp19055_c0_seq1/m.21497 type:complete len:534 (-) comp19055_c0_seq1:677-2278(-)